jgi:hypothetical protein
MEKNSRQTGQTENMPPRLSRRTLLRAGATAMPVILTLQSGEALARTSNLLSNSTGSRVNNKVMCLDTTGMPTYDNGKVDVGNDLMTVYELPDTDFYPGYESGKSGTPMTADMACQNGGFLRTYETGLQKHEANLPQGGLVISNTAMMSVSGRVPISTPSWYDLS